MLTAPDFVIWYKCYQTSQDIGPLAQHPTLLLLLTDLTRSTLQRSETRLGYISKTECLTSLNAMFIFVKFNFTFSAGTPHPSINELTE